MSKMGQWRRKEMGRKAAQQSEETGRWVQGEGRKE